MHHVVIPSEFLGVHGKQRRHERKWQLNWVRRVCVLCGMSTYENDCDDCVNHDGSPLTVGFVTLADGLPGLYNACLLLLQLQKIFDLKLLLDIDAHSRLAMLIAYA